MFDLFRKAFSLSSLPPLSPKHRNRDLAKYENIKSLPDEVIKLIRDVNIPFKDADENFHILLNVLYFDLKRKPELRATVYELLLQYNNKDPTDSHFPEGDQNSQIKITNIQDKRTTTTDYQKEENINILLREDIKEALKKEGESCTTPIIPSQQGTNFRSIPSKIRDRNIHPISSAEPDLFSNKFISSMRKTKMDPMATYPNPFSGSHGNSDCETIEQYPNPIANRTLSYDPDHRISRSLDPTILNVDLPEDLKSIFQQEMTLENPSLRYQTRHKIGKGSFGVVVTAKDLINKSTVALKILKKPFLSNETSILNEIMMMKSCQHENIVNYVHSYLFCNKVWIVMEYCDGGTLFQLLSQMKLCEGQMALICRQILMGLQYLHNLNRVHRDIKSENILFNVNGLVKLADLGLCANLAEEGKTQSLAGSRYWMAPEMIKRHPYDVKVDIWSFGAVCIEMCDGTPPYYKHRSTKALFLTATRGAPQIKHPENYSESLHLFLRHCLQMEPHLRPNAADLLNHPFLLRVCSTKKLQESIRLVFLGNSLQYNRF
eukprot:TRINITY_DN15533_c0_g1_i1.p1 TRINITY_DN15533_c0_g1~~TRINITY_DN15533_c0_g1_i1.p1  ORF type:complete len:547 (+),score=87.61 TRINITY_DN15533_c0_g1_i1:33-1673(+)